MPYMAIAITHLSSLSFTFPPRVPITQDHFFPSSPPSSSFFSLFSLPFAVEIKSQKTKPTLGRNTGLLSAISFSFFLFPSPDLPSSEDLLAGHHRLSIASDLLTLLSHPPFCPLFPLFLFFFLIFSQLKRYFFSYLLHCITTASTYLSLQKVSKFLFTFSTF